MGFLVQLGRSASGGQDEQKEHLLSGEDTLNYRVDSDIKWLVSCIFKY